MVFVLLEMNLSLLKAATASWNWNKSWALIVILNVARLSNWSCALSRISCQLSNLFFFSFKIKLSGDWNEKVRLIYKIQWDCLLKEKEELFALVCILSSVALLLMSIFGCSVPGNVGRASRLFVLACTFAIHHPIWRFKRWLKFDYLKKHNSKLWAMYRMI